MVKRSSGTRITCLSPHLDDGALSCGGILARACAGGRMAHVVTLCTAPAPPPEQLSPFARALHRLWGDPPDPMALRRREDERAMAVLGCTFEHWGYPDAIYRHPAYDSQERLFGTPAEERALEEELRSRCAALPAGLLLFPLAVGHHVDHQLLFRVGYALAGAGRPVAFYEDLPYAAWEGGPQARLEEVGAPLRPVVVEVTPSWETKRAALACYPSQFAALVHEGTPLLVALERYAASLLPGGSAERLWATTAALLCLEEENPWT